MTLLVLGVLLWSVLHLMPAVPLGLRRTLLDSLGENPYKGLFALAMIASMVLMVVGWRSLPREFIYELPEWVDVLSGIFMLAMSVLFFAPYMETNIKRFLRHPQLAGVVFFGIGHTLASGQVRSIVLFGGLAAWALVEMAFINRRDGAWEKPPKTGTASDLKLLAAGLVFFLVLLGLHDWAFGTAIVFD